MQNRAPAAPTQRQLTFPESEQHVKSSLLSGSSEGVGAGAAYARGINGASNEKQSLNTPQPAREPAQRNAYLTPYQSLGNYLKRTKTQSTVQQQPKRDSAFNTHAGPHRKQPQLHSTLSDQPFPGSTIEAHHLERTLQPEEEHHRTHQEQLNAFVRDMDANRTISGASFARTTTDHRGRRDFATNQTHCTSVDVNPMHTELSVGEIVALGGVLKGHGADSVEPRYVE